VTPPSHRRGTPLPAAGRAPSTTRPALSRPPIWTVSGLQRRNERRPPLRRETQPVPTGILRIADENAPCPGRHLYAIVVARHARLAPSPGILDHCSSCHDQTVPTGSCHMTYAAGGASSQSSTPMNVRRVYAASATSGQRYIETTRRSTRQRLRDGRDSRPSRASRRDSGGNSTTTGGR
jgi:hypothetical protein